MYMNKDKIENEIETNIVFNHSFSYFINLSVCVYNKGEFIDHIYSEPYSKATQ